LREEIVWPPKQTLIDMQAGARLTGVGFLALIAVGALSVFIPGAALDVNLSGNVSGAAEAMLANEPAARLRAYLGLLTFAVDALVCAGLALLLFRAAPLIASWSLLVAFGAAVLGLFGPITALNVAEFASAGDGAATGEFALSSRVQLTTEYTSFHLALVLSSVAKAGFFVAFIRGNLIPLWIASWGVFASVFVAAAIVGRDFIPALGADIITNAFLLCNLVAMVLVGGYLLLRGVKVEG
jgi:hypothetical protein